MRNLLAEMARYGVTNADLQTVLSCSPKTVTNKLSDETEFSVGEAIKIRDKFFPSMHIGYLFARSDKAKDSA